MKKLFTLLFAALFAVTASAQDIAPEKIPVVFSPRIKSNLMTGEQTDPPKILGIFKTEKRAAFWLTAGGAVGMVGGAILQGRAAHIIQTEGHHKDWDKYEFTRTGGLTLQCLGAASYGGGFVYRQPRWYKKRPWLWGGIEAVGWFVASKYISEAAYRGRSRE